MVPYELTLCNFMCYRGDLPTLRLDGLHIACLSGENGVGKSALLDALTWVLWGRARMSDDDLIAQGETEMLVDLVFILNGQHYRVTRRRQGKLGRGGKRASGQSWLEFQVRGEQGWRSIGENTIRETQEKIEQVLRMKYDTFINASFLLQGRADEFTRRTPGERKQVLADILDLQEYERLEERARQREKDLAAKVSGLDGAIEVLRQEADKLELYQHYVAEAEQKADRQAEELAAAEEAQRSLDEQVRQLQAREEQRKEVQTRLAKLRAEQIRQQQEAGSLRREIDQDETILQREAAIRAGLATLEEARCRLSHLEELRPRYEMLREQRSHYHDALKDERRKRESDLAMQCSEVQRLRGVVARRPALLADLDRLEQQLAALEPLAEELRRLRERHTLLGERLSRVHSLVLRHQELTSAISQRQDSLVAVREEQKRAIKRLERQLRDRPRWQSELAAALEQQQKLADLSARLDDARQRDREATERAGTLRARCEQFKQQAEEIKKRRELLVDEAATSCPLCGSDLGSAGAASILAHYDRDIAELREHYRLARDEASQLEQSLDDLRTQAQAAEAALRTSQQSVALIETLRQQLGQAGEWQAELGQAQKAMADVEQQLDNQDYEREAREALLSVEAELTELIGMLPRAAGKREGPDWSAAAAPLERERKALERQQASLEQQLDSRTALESKAATCRHELDAIAQAADALPAAEALVISLQQVIEQGDYAHDLRQRMQALEAELVATGYTPEADAAARHAVQQLQHWLDEERDLKIASNRIETNRRTLQHYSELLARCEADIEAGSQEEIALGQELRLLPTLRQQASAAAQAVEECRRELIASQKDLAEKRGWHARAVQAAEQLAHRQEERQSLIGRREMFQELTEALGKRGVQAMLIETAIPEIEREANRLLGRITDNQMHLTFEMQRSTKSGSIAETLEIKIADALGTRIYDSFSGGEATRINFAIRIALSRLLAGRAGASLETLVIDEGMSALDADGRERFIEAITSVQHDFKRILVITHLEEMKDRFPARIEISKTATGSQWTLL